MQKFTYDNTDVKVIVNYGEPWWFLYEICGVLGIPNMVEMVKRLGEDVKEGTSTGSGGKTKKVFMVNENGLYTILSDSDSAEVKSFRRWLTHECIPNIDMSHTATKTEISAIPMMFENQTVDIIIENDEPLFEVYSTGMALGQVKKNAKGVSYPRKDRIDENLKNADIQPCVRNGHSYITESQLYDFMFEAKTDKCKVFRKWLSTEVLPTIRKTGGYVGNEDMFIQTYLPFVDDNTKTLFRQTLTVIRQQNERIEAMKPKAFFADAVSASETSISVGEMAKLLKQNGYDTGEKRFFSWLRDNGYLGKCGASHNVPTQSSMNRGLFEIKESIVQLPNGKSEPTRKPMVTGKGQIHFITKFCNKESN